MLKIIAYVIMAAIASFVIALGIAWFIRGVD